MSKITLINGLRENDSPEFEKQLELLVKERTDIDCFTIRNMKIDYCCGCWSCWLKTPGLCSQKDEMPKILKSIIHSDLLVMISPVVMGFVSPLIKKVNDKIIPSAHPYIGVYKGELHHIKRYDKLPKIALVLVDQNNFPADSVDIINEVYERLAINLRTSFSFSIKSTGSVEGLKNELSCY